MIKEKTGQIKLAIVGSRNPVFFKSLGTTSGCGFNVHFQALKLRQN